MQNFVLGSQFSISISVFPIVPERWPSLFLGLSLSFTASESFVGMLCNKK